MCVYHPSLGKQFSTKTQRNLIHVRKVIMSKYTDCEAEMGNCFSCSLGYFSVQSFNFQIIYEILIFCNTFTSCPSFSQTLLFNQSNVFNDIASYLEQIFILCRKLFKVFFLLILSVVFFTQIPEYIFHIIVIFSIDTSNYSYRLRPAVSTHCFHQRTRVRCPGYLVHCIKAF